MPTQFARRALCSPAVRNTPFCGLPRGFLRFGALRSGDLFGAPTSPSYPFKDNNVFKPLAFIQTLQGPVDSGDGDECEGSEVCDSGGGCDGGENDAWRW